MLIIQYIKNQLQLAVRKILVGRLAGIRNQSGQTNWEDLRFVGPCIFTYRTDHGQQHCYHHVPTVNQRLLLLQLIGS
jgi:hypothetical protein